MEVGIDTANNIIPPGKEMYFHQRWLRTEMCAPFSELVMLQVPGGSLGSKGGCPCIFTCRGAAHKESTLIRGKYLISIGFW